MGALRLLRRVRSGCLALLVVVGACGEPAVRQERVLIRVSGAGSMVEAVSELAQAFQERSPVVDFEITGLGTHVGLAALAAGEADMAMAAWLPPGLPPGLRAVAIARDGIAVIVQSEFPVDGLGLLQLRDLFSGRVERWGELVSCCDSVIVEPVGREDGAASRAAFEALVLEGEEIAPRSVVCLSDEQIVAYVSGLPGAIGYVPMNALGTGVKPIAVEGVIATRDSTSDGTYPITRDLWLVRSEQASEEIKAFERFALSPAGQQIVGRLLGRIR